MIKKYYLYIICFILVMFFGVFMIVFGEHDDSPGAQFLGLIATIGGSVGFVRNMRRVGRRGVISNNEF